MVMFCDGVHQMDDFGTQNEIEHLFRTLSVPRGRRHGTATPKRSRKKTRGKRRGVSSSPRSWKGRSAVSASSVDATAAALLLPRLRTDLILFFRAHDRRTGKQRRPNETHLLARLHTQDWVVRRTARHLSRCGSLLSNPHPLRASAP